MTSGTMPASSPSTVYAEGGPWRLTGRARIRSTSNSRDCGPAMPSGSTSIHHVLPHRPWQQALLMPSMTLPPARQPPPLPPPPSHSSSLQYCHHQVTIYHSTSPYNSHAHHRFMRSNHALSGCSNHTLLGCSELQRHFVRLQLKSKVNLG